MSPPSSTPVVIGVGDFVNRSKRVEDAVEPLQLMLNAIEAAIADTGISESSSRDLRAAVDSLDVVRTWTWPYDDLPGRIAQRLSINPRRKHYTDNGGNQPGLWFDEAARRISEGEAKVAILTGGEALASCKNTAPLTSLCVHFDMTSKSSDPSSMLIND
jgi:acetyl-CoA acetyltransferase